MINKKNSFGIIVLWFFGMISFYFTPRLLSFLFIAPNVFAFLGVLVFAVIFNLFFYYIVFNIAAVIFSNLFRGRLIGDVKNIELDIKSSVAILYVTKDDFNVQACESCLNQRYDNFRVFILDDSVSSEKRNVIDNFAVKYCDRVEVIRRNNNQGFKAGNINHALNKIYKDFDFFAVTDSDGVLPDDFITSLLKYFHLDKNIGFVQACCCTKSLQGSLFACDMAKQVDIHWKHFMPYHNVFGFVMFYGHSALIKTSVWKNIDGFPEVVSEDLAFSSKIRESGFRGVIAENVWTLEDVPDNYERFRFRHEKWVRGTTEYLKKNFFKLLFLKKIRWFEKLDLISSCFSMLMSAPFIFFIMLIAFVLPLFFQAFKMSGAAFSLPVATPGKQAMDYLSGFRYNMYWSLDFYLVVALGLLYPIIPAFFEFKGRLRKLLRYVFVSTGIYTSLTVSSTLSVVSYLFTGKTFFPVTGDMETKKSVASSNEGILDFRSNSLKVQVVELLAFIILIVVSVINLNYWFMPIGIGSLLAVLLLNFQKYEIVRWLVCFPFTIQIGLLCFIGMNLIW